MEQFQAIIFIYQNLGCEEIQLFEMVNSLSSIAAPLGKGLFSQRMAA